MRPGAPRLAELLSCRLLIVLLMCRPGLPADQRGTKKTLTIGYLAAMTVSALLFPNGFEMFLFMSQFPFSRGIHFQMRKSYTVSLHDPYHK